MSQIPLLGNAPLDASASGVFFEDAGNVLGGGSIDLQTAITAIISGTLGVYLTRDDGGGGLVQAHGNLGATETIDTANGNYHWGTLNANCTFTFTTIVDTAERWFTLELIEDGAGGWFPTWPGTVSWLGGSAPIHDTTAGTTTIYVFFTRNGGTTWIGGQLGASGTPATTVTDETTFGISPAVGTDTEYARQDHTHGSPSTTAVQNAGRWERVTEPGSSAPPVDVYSPDGTEWVYSFVPA